MDDIKSTTGDAMMGDEANNTTNRTITKSVDIGQFKKCVIYPAGSLPVVLTADEIIGASWDDILKTVVKRMDEQN